MLLLENNQFLEHTTVNLDPKCSIMKWAIYTVLSGNTYSQYIFSINDNYSTHNPLSSSLPCHEQQ